MLFIVKVQKEAIIILKLLYSELKATTSIIVSQIILYLLMAT